MNGPMRSRGIELSAMQNTKGISPVVKVDYFMVFVLFYMHFISPALKKYNKKKKKKRWRTKQHHQQQRCDNYKKCPYCLKINALECEL